MVVKMPWLALAAGLLLFGCAASSPAPKEQAQAEPPAAQKCLTVQELKEGMAQEVGVKQRADLEGEPLQAFIEWLAPHLEGGAAGILAQSNRVIMFEQDDAVLIVFFKGDCALTHMTAPWEPIKAFLLSRPHV